MTSADIGDNGRQKKKKLSVVLRASKLNISHGIFLILLFTLHLLLLLDSSKYFQLPREKRSRIGFSAFQ